MCMFFTLLLAGPRAGVLLWWLVNPARWDAAFSSVIWPILGFFFLPWTTIMFVAVAPFGNVAGWDWLWLAFAFMVDITTDFGGGYTNRGRMPGYA